MSVNESTSECSEVAGVGIITDDVFDMQLECGECKFGGSMTLAHMTKQCTRLRAEVARGEKCVLELEREEAEQQVQESLEICPACRHVLDPRQRKLAELCKLHLQVLTNKPPDMLCTPGIFSRLEDMTSKGFLDSVVAVGTRCPKCRQVCDVTAGKAVMSSEIVDILKQEYSAPQPERSECCLEKACSKCLYFVISLLEDSELPLQLSVPPNNTSLTTEVKSGDIDASHFVPLDLSPFSGEPWESPQLAVKVWEHNLKLSRIPTNEWCALVCTVLEDTAAEWCMEQKAAEKTWKNFTESFVQHFNENLKIVIDHFMEIILAEDNFRKISGEGLEQFLLVCLRALGNDIKALTSLFKVSTNLCTYHGKCNYHHLAANISSDSSDSLVELYRVLLALRVADGRSCTLFRNLMKGAAKQILKPCTLANLGQFLI